MIRTMVPGDIEQVVALCRRLHQRSRYSRFKPHWPTVLQTITKAATSPAGRVIVAEHDGKITGLIIAVVQEFWWAEPKAGPRVVSDLLFYSQRIGDGEQMMKAMVEWAWSVPRVVRVEIGVSSGIKTERTESFYRSMGFDYMGPMFEAEHPKLKEKPQCLAS